jgi:Domain of unknown function (DUF4351)
MKIAPDAATGKRFADQLVKVHRKGGKAILCDANPAWRPNQYGFAVPGTRLDFEFSIAKLLDYRDRWAELEASQNPFAWVVMAHLKMQETRRDKPSRKVWKMRRSEGCMSQAKRQLNRKVGSVQDSALELINALSLEQIESLGEALLDFESINDLTT